MSIEGSNPPFASSILQEVGDLVEENDLGLLYVMPVTITVMAIAGKQFYNQAIALSHFPKKTSTDSQKAIHLMSVTIL
jgi:hypothetical protein